MMWFILVGNDLFLALGVSIESQFKFSPAIGEYFNESYAIPFALSPSCASPDVVVGMHIWHYKGEYVRVLLTLLIIMVSSRLNGRGIRHSF